MDFDRQAAEEALAELLRQGEMGECDGRVLWLKPDPAFLATQMDGRRTNEAAHLCMMLDQLSDVDRPMAKEDLFEEARKQGVTDPEGAWKFVVTRMGRQVREVGPNRFTTKAKAERRSDTGASPSTPTG